MKKLSFITFIILLTACTSSVDSNFVGQWKFYKITPNNKPNDISMNGLICPLKKLEGANETYSFLFFDNEFVTTKKDNNTLIGANGAFTLKYDNSNQHLIFIMGSKENKNNYSEIEFEKLK